MGSLHVEAGIIDNGNRRLEEEEEEEEESNSESNEDSRSRKLLTGSTYNWTKVWGIKGNQGNEWHHGSVVLPLNTEKVRFVATTGNNYQSDIAVDDVLITQVSHMHQ
jgi:hypothetical protein